MKKHYSKPQLFILKDDSVRIDDFQIIMRFSDEGAAGTVKAIGQALCDQLQTPGRNAIFCQENENMR